MSEGLAVAAKKTRLPTIHHRDVIEGYVHTYDHDGRLCLDTKNPERLVLIHDLRVYGDGLHIGQLGWTIPETTDGYKAVDVLFDTGHRLCVNRYAFERVDLATEQEMANALVAKFRNSRFDSDVSVAHARRKDWIADTYGKYMSLDQTSQTGVGDQELYAFTFPSLRELAGLKGQEHYPVKIGFSKNASEGAFGRIRQQIVELAGYPERPEILSVWRTWDGRSLETQVHRTLRKSDRKIPTSLGKEWFLTSHAEVLQIVLQCALPEFPVDRVVGGADETLEENFAALIANGATVEFGMVSGSASVSIGIRNPPDPDGQSPSYAI